MRLVLNNAELADAVALVDVNGPCCIAWEAPFVIVSAVGIVEDAHRVGLNKAPALECGGSWASVPLVAVRMLHSYPKRDNQEVARLHVGIDAGV